LKKFAKVGLLAVLVAGAFVLAAVPMGTLGKVTDFGASGDHTAQGPKHNGTGADDKNVTDETQGNMTPIAGGGGWQLVNMSGVLYKNTFGCIVGMKDNETVGEFAFQARDQGVTIHGCNVTSVQVDNTSVENVTIVDVHGWAVYNKSAGFWFNLVLVDGGNASSDMLKLFIYKDLDGNWTMDEGTPMVQWVFEGLGGGNIWAGPGASDSDM